MHQLTGNEDRDPAGKLGPPSTGPTRVCDFCQNAGSEAAVGRLGAGWPPASQGEVLWSKKSWVSGRRVFFSGTLFGPHRYLMDGKELWDLPVVGPLMLSGF